MNKILILLFFVININASSLNCENTKKDYCIAYYIGAGFHALYFINMTKYGIKLTQGYAILGNKKIDLKNTIIPSYKKIELLRIEIKESKNFFEKKYYKWSWKGEWI